jgi:hypothetical protein
VQGLPFTAVEIEAAIHEAVDELGGGGRTGSAANVEGLS